MATQALRKSFWEHAHFSRASLAAIMAMSAFIPSINNSGGGRKILLYQNVIDLKVIFRQFFLKSKKTIDKETKKL
jgi:hypothetical protein